MKKRILLINWRDIQNPEAGGAEVYYHEIFKRLTPFYEITVLSHAFPGGAPSLEINSINVLRRGGRGWFNAAVIPFVRRHADEYDLIIEDLNKVPFFTPLYTRRPRLHLVMHFFGATIFQQVRFPSAAYVYTMERLVPVFYRRERFVAISNSTRDEVAAFCGDAGRVAVVEPGIDLSAYPAPSQKASPPYLLYLGRLKKYKNLQFVLRALPKLQLEFPGLLLKVAGTGDYQESLHSLVRSLSLEASVVFLGFVGEAQKNELLRSAALVVNPSYKEGWGITNIEANICGTVSLSSRVPGLQDSVRDGETGLLYTPGDENEFIQKASALLKDPARRAAMEVRALAFAREFSWERQAEKMRAAIEVA